MPTRRGRRSTRNAGVVGALPQQACADGRGVSCMPGGGKSACADANPVTSQRLSPAASPAQSASEIGASSWQRYPSIDAADHEQVAKIRRATEGQPVEFVGVEKVHGSNFAFETDGQTIQYFSRNRRLEASEPFIKKTCPGEAMQRYHSAVLEVFRLCSATSPGVRNVLIYGEYFGGWYPHDAVRQTGPGAGAPVQKGIVAYSPQHRFFAFDLCIDGIFCDFDFCVKMLECAGFPLVAKPLVRGSFEDCMNFEVESLRTTLPTLLGLPVCEAFCIAEGIIVKPIHHRKSWILKRKSVRYLEGCPNELRKWVAKCAESPEQAVLELYLSLCRRPRLDAVLSKEPQLREQPTVSLPKVQAMFREDVEADLQKKLATTEARVSEVSFHEVRAEADRRVAQWLLEGDASQASMSRGGGVRCRCVALSLIVAIAALLVEAMNIHLAVRFTDKLGALRFS